MNFKNKSFWLLAVSGSLLFGSCKKGFLDVNENPNSPTDLNITPELLFTQAANAVGQRQGSANLTFLMNWLGYTGASGSYALDGTETSYNIDQNFGEGIWANNYNVLYDLYLAKTKALAKGDTVLAGASMILSTKLWQDLVDLFGNIPYKQAFGGGGNPRPGYDAAQSIYNDLQLTLDTAKSYMGRTARTTFTGLDIVNGGNQTNWIRFANTMKLRLLIHQSNVIGATPPTAEITKIMDGGSSLNIIRTAAQTADVNPGYLNEANKQQPFYAAYGFTPTAASANEITRANNYVLNELSNNNDPRIARLFTTISGNYIGVDYGLSAGNPTSGAASRFGPGLVTAATSAQWIMTSIESLFLEAEAIARGWVPGNAQTAYNAAVTESFTFLGLTASSATTYLNNSAAAAWPTTGPADQIKRILYQKYIALTPIDPIEVYTDFRRVPGYLPAGFLSVNPSRNNQGIPNRLLLPQSEFTTNTANALAQNVTSPYQKLFWQP